MGTVIATQPSTSLYHPVRILNTHQLIPERAIPKRATVAGVNFDVWFCQA